MRTILASFILASTAISVSAPAHAQTLNTLYPPLAAITASDGAVNDQLGASVALDGDTMAVGAPSDTVGTNSGQGSVRVYVRSGSMWTLQATLTASDGAASDAFGWSVAIDGDTIAVGVRSDDVGTNPNQGSVRVFTRSGTTWTAQAALTASDGAATDELGWSVAISGDTIAVGARLDDVGANVDQGSVRVYARSGTAWTAQAALTASDGAATDQFGYSVSIDGDTIAVGASEDDVGSVVNQGSVRVFTRSGTSWTAQATVTAADGAASDYFGDVVVVEGDTLAVTAAFDNVGSNPDQGSVRVFTRSGAIWTAQATLAASDGAASDFFGEALAMSGDTIVAGARLDDVGSAADEGTARVFVRAGSTWIPQVTLTASDGAAGDYFGDAVAVSGETIVAGMPLDDIGSLANQGSVRVFGNHRLYNQSGNFFQPSLAAGVGSAFVGERLVVGNAALSQASGIIDATQKRLTFVGVEPMTLGANALMMVANESVFMRSPDVAAAGLTVLGKLTAPLNGTVTFEQLAIGSGGQFLQRNSTVLVNDTFATANGGVAYLQGPVLAEGVSTAVGGQHRVVADADIFSNYSNAGSTVIQRGILYIYGSLSNAGTITGEVNNGLLPPNPGDGYSIGGDYSVAASSSIVLPDPVWWLRVGGSLDMAINDPARFVMAVATLEMTGTGTSPQQSLEVFGRDDGAVDASFAASNYLLGALRVRAGATVELVDNHNNASGKGREAIYTNALFVPAGATLVTNGYKVYTRAATIAGAVSDPADVVVVPEAPPCPGDIYEDGVVNSADLGILLSAWGACGGGECPADINADGQVDSADLGELLSGWGPCAN